MTEEEKIIEDTRKYTVSLIVVILSFIAFIITKEKIFLFGSGFGVGYSWDLCIEDWKDIIKSFRRRK